VVDAAIKGRGRLDAMRDFFEGVGTGDAAGVWEDVPKDHPGFREMNRRRLDAANRARKASEETF
jgi:chlorophyllide a reductase subunit Y